MLDKATADRIWNKMIKTRAARLDISEEEAARPISELPEPTEGSFPLEENS
jgi:hypothetical protein